MMGTCEPGKESGMGKKKKRIGEFFEEMIHRNASDKRSRSVKPNNKEIRKYSFVKSARTRHPFIPMEKEKSAYLGFKLTSHHDKKRKVIKLPANPMSGSRRPSYIYKKPVKEPASGLWKPKDYSSAKVRKQNKEILKKEFDTFKKKKGR